MAMHKVMRTAVLAAVLALPFAPGPFAPAHAQGIRAPSLQRTTLVVGDIEKSIDFYQRLGLVKLSDTPGGEAGSEVFGAADLPLTSDAKTSRFVVMKGGDTAMLALLWYDRPPLPSARGNLVGMGIGDVIVGVEVSDLQGAYTRLNQIGTRFQRPPVRFTLPGADGTPQSGQHMLAYDPDGRLVQVTQPDRR